MMSVAAGAGDGQLPISGDNHELQESQTPISWYKPSMPWRA